MRPIGTLRCLVLPFVVAKGSVPSIIRRCRTWNLGSCLSIVPLQIGTLHCLAPFFVVVKVRSGQLSRAISDIEPRRLIIDRATANARVIRGAPEAIALTLIVAIGVFYFAFQHLHRERVAVLSDRISSQEALLNDYRTNLRGATPEQAATQIEKLTGLLAEAQNSLNEARVKPVSVQNRSRDPRRLYDGNSPIALTQDPKIDVEKKKITFPIVKAAVTLGTSKVYEFRDWKLACGGTQLYNTVNDSAARQFSYSPLTCKIVGNR